MPGDALAATDLIAAKRYALFNKVGARIVLRKWSEHGLGHLLDPRDPVGEALEAGMTDGSEPDSEIENATAVKEPEAYKLWIKEAWQHILEVDVLGQVSVLPDWSARPAVGRITGSSPAVLRAFAQLNKGKPYAAQVKPFNFLLSAHLEPCRSAGRRGRNPVPVDRPF